MTSKPHSDTHARIRQAAADMADIARLWETYVRQMNDHVPGVKSTLGGGGRRGSGVSDPTGEAIAAAQALDGDGNPRGWRTDPIVATHTRVLADLSVIVGMIDATRATITATVHPSAGPDRNQPVECLTASCTDIIETKLSEFALSPYCPPCHRWMAEHDGRPVPAAVVADRRRKREQRERAGQPA